MNIESDSNLRPVQRQAEESGKDRGTFIRVINADELLYGPSNARDIAVVHPLAVLRKITRR